MLPRLTLTALTIAALAGCTAEMDRTQQVDAPAIRVVGEAEDCIRVSRIDNTEVHDDYTIDFEMAGGVTYRNTLPNRCFSLGFEEAFAYDASPAGQLCDVDTITVLHSDGETGATCQLGEFLPVEFVED